MKDTSLGFRIVCVCCETLRKCDEDEKWKSDQAHCMWWLCIGSERFFSEMESLSGVLILKTFILV